TSRGIQFVFNFSTVANVVPDGAKAKVEVVSAEPSAGKLRLTLRNAGNKYANLSLSTLALTAGTYNAEIKGAAWQKALGSNWILPGATRVVDLALPAQAPQGVSAKLNYVEAEF